MLLPSYTVFLVFFLNTVSGKGVCPPNLGCKSHKISGSFITLGLPQMFKARIEVKDDKSNTTTLIEEYYDMERHKMGIVTVYHDRSVSTQILDYKHKKVIHYNVSNCWMQTMNPSLRLEIPFKSAVDIFQFKRSFQEVRDTVIRNMPVKNVRTCVCEDQLNATLDYFLYNLSSTPSADSNFPLRVEVKGTVLASDGKNQPFNHVYDFLTFEHEVAIDQKVFEIPAGVVCNESIHFKPLPKILPQFTTHGEVINARNKRLSVFKILLDMSTELVRTEFYPEINSNSSSGESIRLITDHKLGIQYVLDSIYQPCLVKPIPGTPVPRQKLAWTEVLHMDDIYSVMKLDSKTFSYKGQLSFRGIIADVWGKQYRRDDGTTINREYYFLDSGATHFHVPIGIYQKVFDTNTEVINESWMHLYGYVQGHVHLDNFNIEACFLMRDRIYINFRLKGKFDVYIKGYQSVIFPALRNALAKAANISSVRISDIQIGRLSADQMIIHFTLLDAPVIPRYLKPKYWPLSLQTAYDTMKAKKRISFKVFYPGMDEKVFTFETDTFESLVRDYEPVLQPHTKGAMVGLGLGMLILGTCTGLLAGYFIYKRILATEVPYELTK